MRQFYLGKNSSGYYRVYFVDPVTGTRGPGKSTHTKDKVEATLIAGQWLKEGVPAAKSHSRAFASGSSELYSGDLKSFVAHLSEEDALQALELLSQKLHKSIIPTLSEEQVETPVEIKNETADPASTKKRYVVIKKKNSEPLGKKSRKQKAAKSFCFAILLKTYGIMISQSFFTATFPEAIRCLRNTHFACMHL